MNEQILIPTSKSELKQALTSKTDGYSYTYFRGEIRCGERYVKARYYFTGNKITIQIEYWQDGANRSVDYSHCSTPNAATNKIARYLNLN